MHSSLHTYLGDIFHAQSSLLTSMKKVLLCQFTTPILQPTQAFKDTAQDQIPRVLNESSHNRYSLVLEASTFSLV